uniref:glutathione transferase n=1 Tax=Dendroctonus armandi TaxID=77159 RepID=A0A0C4XBP6_9CUCU|nr:glutathione S-transeferase [Dendroctonus armandi]
MPVLKYYYDLLSQPSRAIYIFLKLANIPFQSCPVALRTGEHQTEDFKSSMNRFQKVPFIHHGDFKLAESVAIVRYLAREYRDLVPDKWYPAESKAQARVDEYLAWQHANTRIPCATYFFYKYIIPAMTKSPPDETELGKLESNLVTCLDQLEDLWLSPASKYIAGDSISVADIFAACELEQTRLASYDVTKNRPILKAWLERVREECNPAYSEAHAVLNKLVAKKSQSKL